MLCSPDRFSFGSERKVPEEGLEHPAENPGIIARSDLGGVHTRELPVASSGAGVLLFDEIGLARWSGLSDTGSSKCGGGGLEKITTGITYDQML